MKHIFRVSVSLALALIFCFQAVNACSVIAVPLRKQFRVAESVFVGKVLKTTKSYAPNYNEKRNIPKYLRENDWAFSKVTFEITNSWKGHFADQQEFVSINIDSCPCDEIRQFQEGKEYLVYASGKNFVTICDSQETNYQGTKDEMKSLDSFWFRTWARIYPF